MFRSLVEQRPPGVRLDSGEGLERVRRHVPRLRTERRFQLLRPLCEPRDRVVVFAARSRQKIDRPQDDGRLQIVEVTEECRAVARSGRVSREHIQHLVANCDGGVAREQIDDLLELVSLSVESECDQAPDLCIGVVRGPHERLHVVVARLLQCHQGQQFYARRTARCPQPQRLARLGADEPLRIAPDQRFEALRGALDPTRGLRCVLDQERFDLIAGRVVRVLQPAERLQDHCGYADVLLNFEARFER